MNYSRPPPAPSRPRRPLGKPCQGCGAPDDGGHTCSYCRSPFEYVSARLTLPGMFTPNELRAAEGLGRIEVTCISDDVRRFIPANSTGNTGFR